MIPRATLERLTDALGREAVEEHEHLEIDGAEPTVTIRPADGEALARTLAALGSCGLAALVKGGGNRLGIGNLPSRGEVLLSSAGLRAIFRAKKTMAAKNATVLVVHLTRPVKKVFDIVKAMPTESVFASWDELDAYLDQMQKKVTEED